MTSSRTADIRALLATAAVLLSAGCDANPSVVTPPREVPATTAVASDPAAAANELWSNGHTEAFQLDSTTGEGPDFVFQELDPLKIDVLESPQAELAEIAVVGFATQDESRVLLKTISGTQSYALGEHVEGFQITGIDSPAVSLTQDEVSYIIDLSNNHQAPGLRGSIVFPGLGSEDELSIAAPTPASPEDQLDQLGQPELVVPDDSDQFFNPDDLLLDDRRQTGGP